LQMFENKVLGKVTKVLQNEALTRAENSGGWIGND
jgi:hypothetical protein